MSCLRLFSLKLLFLIVLVNSIPSRAEAIPNGKLVIQIEGLKEQRGQVCLSLFASSQGFPSQGDRAVQARCVKVTSLPLIVTFENLKTGNYAIAAFYDSNGDGVLNQNRLGIPTERFGFSQNPRIVAGPPKFSESAVLVVSAETDIQIRLQSLFGS